MAKRTPARGAARRPLTPADLPPSEAAAWNAFSYLPGGLLLGGLAGWGLDRWLGTSWIIGVGLLAGVALSLYVIWVRYGSAERTGGAPVSTAQRTPPPVTQRRTPAEPHRTTPTEEML